MGERRPLGIFAKTFHGSAPLDVLTQVRDAGYDCVQYNMTCSGLDTLPLVVNPRDVAAIVDAVAQTGVHLAALSATYNMIHPDPVRRASGQQSLEVLAEIAVSLGIPVVTVCTGSRNAADQWAGHPDNASADAWRDLCVSMEHALAALGSRAVAIGIEPEPGNVVASVRHAWRLLDELGDDRVAVVLDVANLLDGAALASSDAQRTLVRDAVDRLGDRIVLVHAKDRAVDGSVVPVGQGVIDFESLFDALDSAGICVPVITHGLQSADAIDVRHRLVRWHRLRGAADSSHRA